MGDLEFYKQNPVIIFDDIYRSGTWKVFAVIKVNTLASRARRSPTCRESSRLRKASWNMWSRSEAAP